MNSEQASFLHLKCTRGTRWNGIKQQKACDEVVLRRKEFRLNFAPAAEVRTSTSSLQCEYSSYQQIGYFTVVARDTFCICDRKGASLNPIMQELWGQGEKQHKEVSHLMVRTENRECKDNIGV